MHLLHDNLTPHGILAATPSPQADERRYSTVFTRDAAICGIGMTEPMVAPGAARNRRSSAK